MNESACCLVITFQNHCVMYVYYKRQCTPKYQSCWPCVVKLYIPINSADGHKADVTHAQTCPNAFLFFIVQTCLIFENNVKCYNVRNHVFGRCWSPLNRKEMIKTQTHPEVVWQRAKQPSRWCDRWHILTQFDSYRIQSDMKLKISVFLGQMLLS